AGGGVVGEDGRQQVGERDPARREVEPAALACAAADARRPTVGPVECDETVVEHEVRRAEWVWSAVEDAAAQAVAAVAAQAAGAPNGQVADQPLRGNGEDPAVLVRDAATLAGPAVATRGGAADGLVAEKRAVGDGGGCGYGHGKGGDPGNEVRDP